MKKHKTALCLLFLILSNTAFTDENPAPVKYTGKTASLQEVIDNASPGAVIVCDPQQQMELSEPLTINKKLTLKGLSARLPKGLGKTSLVIVKARGVTLKDITLHGNYDSVSQDNRAPLIIIRKGDFRVENCKFYDSTKDGVKICPEKKGNDIVGGTVKNIEAFRIGRDAVSISGGNRGQKVRDITVENVRLVKGYLRGAVEISDGTDNITVRNVYAEKCPYAIDVQDHRGRSAPNTNITVEDVTAVNCKHIIRTANSNRGHSGLTLRKFKGITCKEPVRISNTSDVTIEGLTIEKHHSRHRPVLLRNCSGVTIKNVSIEATRFTRKLMRMKNCSDVEIEDAP